MTNITFLGTGGGRFATIYQTRSTGGIFLDGTRRMHIDPGPGTLLRMKQLGIKPTDLDAVFISHSHPDHYTDAEVLIEAMSRGGLEKRGIVLAAESVIKGDGKFGPAISGYHCSLPEVLKILLPGDEYDLGVRVKATRSFHADFTTIGLQIFEREGMIAYVSDTELREEVIEQNMGARIIILPVTRPLGERIKGHLCTEDAAKIVEAIRPELAIFTHFGLKCIREGPNLQAEWTWKKTGIKTIAAVDSMTISMREEITASRRVGVQKR